MGIGKLVPSYLKKSLDRKLDFFVRTHPELKKFETRLVRAEARVGQLQDVLEIYHKLLVPPPRGLQERIVGGYFEDYIRSGVRSVNEISSIIAGQGKSLADFTSVLDFGCGSGRVFLPLHYQHPTLAISGADIDEEAISYCNRHYSRIGTFMVNPHRGPSGFSDNSFDLVYGISVFTHLPEDMQFEWLADLKRITRPGGYLLLSVENKKTEIILNPEQKEEFLRKGFYFYVGNLTDGLPEFYRTTLHSHEYIRKEWSSFFDILDIIPKGMGNHQDYVVCRAREKS